MSPEFKKRLDQEIRVRLQEMRDGCVDCLSVRRRDGFCYEHEKQAMDLILSPRKYIRLKPATAAK